MDRRIGPNKVLKFERKTLIFLCHLVVRASGYAAVLSVEDDGPGGLFFHTACHVLFCFTLLKKMFMMMTMETQKHSDKHGDGPVGSYDGRAFVPP